VASAVAAGGVAARRRKERRDARALVNDASEVKNPSRKEVGVAFKNAQKIHISRCNLSPISECTNWNFGRFQKRSNVQNLNAQNPWRYIYISQQKDVRGCSGVVSAQVFAKELKKKPQKNPKRCSRTAIAEFCATKIFFR
jgi:hypothetical protein